MKVYILLVHNSIYSAYTTREAAVTMRNKLLTENKYNEPEDYDIVMSNLNS